MTTNIQGVETHYQRIGKTGKFLFLLHGWGCTWEIWSPVISQLSEKYQLIIPDLPSFGTSAEPKEVWDTTTFVKWFKLFVEETIGTEKFSVVGHSFGGKIAALYASHQPKQLSKLVLVDASGLPDPLPQSKQVQENIMSLLPKQLKNLISESIKKKFVEMTGSSTDYRNASTYQREILKKIFKEDLASKLDQIKTPTIIAWGRRDLETPFHQGERFHQLIADSKLEIFEQSGHFPFVDESQKFIQTIDTFLS